MYALSLAASLLSSAGAGSLREDVEACVGTAPDAGTVSGRCEVDEDWPCTDVSARALVAVPDVVC